VLHEVVHICSSASCCCFKGPSWVSRHLVARLPTHTFLCLLDLDDFRRPLSSEEDEEDEGLLPLWRLPILSASGLFRCMVPVRESGARDCKQVMTEPRSGFRLVKH